MTILNTLKIQLVIASIVLMTFLGVILWVIMNKFALVPMEREVADHILSEKTIAKERDTLEGLVLKRTLDLEESNRDLRREIEDRKGLEGELKKRVKELEDFYDMAVGREVRMRGLQKEVKELKAKLQKHPGAPDT